VSTKKKSRKQEREVSDVEDWDKIRGKHMRNNSSVYNKKRGMKRNGRIKFV